MAIIITICFPMIFPGFSYDFGVLGTKSFGLVGCFAGSFAGNALGFHDDVGSYGLGFHDDEVPRLGLPQPTTSAQGWRLEENHRKIIGTS